MAHRLHKAYTSSCQPALHPLRFTFLCVFLFGLIAHAFAFLNTNFSHDGLYVVQTDNEWQISLGRVLQPVYRSLRGWFSAPWLLGLLSLLYIAVSAYLIIKLLDIRSRWGITAVCGFLTVNISITCLFATYMYCADTFLLALLLAVWGVYVLRRYRFGFLLSAILFSCSMGLYQSYIAVAITLLMILLIQDLLDSTPFRYVLVSACKSVGALLFSALGYLLLMKLILLFTGITPNDGYNTVTGVFDFQGISIPHLFLNIYTYLANFFIRPKSFQPLSSVIVTFFLGGLAFCSLFGIIRRRRLKKFCTALLIVILCVLPLGIDFIFLLTKGWTIHHLMIYSFFLVFVFAIMLYEKQRISADEAATRPLSLLKHGCVLLCCGIWFLNSIAYANGAYLKKDMEEKAGLSLMTRVVDRMEQTEGYVAGETPVILINSDYPGNAELTAFDAYFQETGLEGTLPVTYYATYERYFQYILQQPLLLLPESTANEWAKRETVAQMPAFPHTDSVQMIEGTLVIKLQENTADNNAAS